MYDPLDTISRECFRSFSVLPNARLIDEHGAFGVMTDVPMTFFNGIATAEAPEIAAVIDVYRSRNRAFRWWVRDGLGSELIEHGLRFAYKSAGMTCDLAQLAAVPSPSDLSIRQVHDRRAMADWAHVLTTVFERPSSEADWWVDSFDTIGFEGDWSHFVGYVDEAPVATASVLTRGDVVGVYDVGSLKSMRGRGFGSAITRAALEHARDRGAKEAALQSSDMAVSVYRGLGFTQRATLSMYTWTGA